MARLRKGCAYRRIERPYTRKSKYRKKSFVRASPTSKVVRYHMGNLQKEFETSFDLVIKESLQLRHNCLESARLAANRTLEKALGKVGFRLVLKPFPHHVLRENPLAAGAGADRMSTGMKRSFGKPIGIAARVRENQVVFTAEVDKANIETARRALKKASTKLPGGYAIVQTK